MSELSKEARKLLDGAGVPAPNSASRARMKRAIIAAGIAGPASAVAASASKPVIGLLSGLFGQILGGTAAIAVGAGTVWGVQHAQKWSKAEQREQPSRVQLAVPQELIVPPPVSAVDVPVVAQPVPAPAPKKSARVETPEKRIAESTQGTRPEPTPELPDRPAIVESTVPSVARKSPPPPVVDEASSFREEIELLRQAVLQRDASQWTAAIETLNRYDTKFPAGSLHIEALSLRADALCALNRRDEARAIAGQLDNTAKRRRQDFCTNE